MIKINENPIISRIIEHKHCATIIITNYEKCHLHFLEIVAKLAFVINTTSYYPDLVCVISNDNLDEFMYYLIRVSSFCKVESEI